MARTLIDSGWDVKHVIRLIVTSATYRQSSDASAELLARDPENILLARGPRFRLPAEMIRDGALAASGMLVDTIGGPPVKPFQPPGLWEEKSGLTYQRDTGAGSHRRSLYTFWKRTSPPPAMLTFDATTREVCADAKARTLDRIPPRRSRIQPHHHRIPTGICDRNALDGAPPRRHRNAAWVRAGGRDLGARRDGSRSRRHGVGFGIARLALGFGEAGMFPAAVKAIAQWFPKKERALATGLFNSGTTAGAIITPIAVPVIVSAAGPRAAFVATGALALLWAAFWLFQYAPAQEHPRATARELEHILSEPITTSAKIPWRYLLARRRERGHSPRPSFSPTHSGGSTSSGYRTSFTGDMGCSSRRWPCRWPSSISCRGSGASPEVGSRRA